LIRKEEFNEETPIFANHSRNAKRNYLSDMGLRKIIENAIKKAGIERVKTDTKYDKATITMFRKRFNGKLKMENLVNSNIAEKLMAHKRGLDGTYLQPTKEECFSEFAKAIPALSVSDEERQKLKLIQQEKKISEYEKSQKKIEHLEKGINLLEVIMDEQKLKNYYWLELEHPTHKHTKSQNDNLKKFCETEHQPEAWKMLIDWSKLEKI